MDPFDRFLRRPLDQMLVAQGVATRERMDELLASARETNESLGVVLLESGALSPWDFAKTIASQYQLPVQSLSGYRFDKDLVSSVPPEVLHRHQVMPLGVFGRTRTFAIMEPPTRELLDELQSRHGSSLFFFVAQGPEIARALREHVKVVDVDRDTSWQRLFDSAEEEVTKGAGPAKAR